MRPKPAILLLTLALLAPAGVRAIDLADTRLVADPATSGRLVAFAYANDLWVAGTDGSGVRRLTSHPGVESGPRFSPDGSLVAFTGRYEANVDVYVVPAAGGVPKRLTYHPGNDVALGFTPDGRSVLFSSGREVYTGRYTQLFTVPVDGGFPTRLPIPNASKAQISPDGKTTAYVPLSEAFNQWKRYRGGTTARILLFDNASHAVEPVPQPAGRCNDTDPMWVGGRLVFRSDRDGEFNLYAFDRGTKTVTRLTSHVDFPVVSTSAGGGRIAYEQAGYVHLLDPATGASTRLKLGVAADLVELRGRWAKGAKWIRSSSLSPSGARVALEFRGEVVTLPREKGDDRNVTQSPAVHDRSPAWSPDGKWIAWFSDEGGEYGLVLSPQDGKGAAAEDPAPGLRLLRPGEVVARLEEAQLLRQLDDDLRPRRGDRRPGEGGERPPVRAGSGAPPRVVARLALPRLHAEHAHLLQPALPLLGRGREVPPGERRPRRRHEPRLRRLRQVPLLPRLDRRGPGQRLVLAGERRHAHGAAGLRGGAREGSPVAAREGERRGEGEGGGEAGGRREGGGPRRRRTKADEPKKDEKKPVEVKFDADGLSQRILALPAKAGVYSDLAAGPANQIFYRRAASTDPDADAAIYRYDLEKRKEDTLLDKADGFELSADAKRALVRVKEDWLHRGRGGQARPREVQARRRPRPGAGGPDGGVGADASTRRGASTGTTSTTPASTARTGRR